MLIKGEKYACKACVRGHRVSNCQHSDRPLQHINKKGRPVSQCVHCRSLRKSRSAHVRCECGEKAHTEASCGQDMDDGCCCSHGARCTCALKKEHHLDPVPESDSDEASSTSVPVQSVGRPRASTTQSDGNVTTASNGQHKPIHKHNNMAHKCGLPYVVPRAHSVHGSSPAALAALANKSVDNLPNTSTVDALHSESQINDSMVSAQQEVRLVKSEHGSPVFGGVLNLEQVNGLPPLDLSNLSTDYAFVPNLDGSVADHEPPLFSAGLSAPSIDWSHYDGLEFHNDSFTSSYSQPPSWFDFSSVDQPGLTSTSTSGDLSEVDEFGPVGDISRVPLNVASNTDTCSKKDEPRSTTSSYNILPISATAEDSIEAFSVESFFDDTSTTAAMISSGLSANVLLDEVKTDVEGNGLELLGLGDEIGGLWMNDFMLNEGPVGTDAPLRESSNAWAQ